MSKPYVIVHMMTSIDGRIDCGMTAQLDGNREYYSTLDGLDAPTRVSGRVTAQTEMNGGQTVPTDGPSLGHADFSHPYDAPAYNIIADTYGTLAWPKEGHSDFPHLILLSEDVSQAYINYLNQQGIAWIAAGKGQIDLAAALNTLGSEFGIKRLAVVGGGKINAGFLNAGVVDEISLLIGPGVDGRTGQPAVFDGRQSDQPLPLKLKSVQSFDDGAVYLRYLTK